MCRGQEDVELFPDFRFVIDGEEYILPRESYVLAEGNECALKFMTSNQIDILILGLNFFENYYTVFDQENRRIGFAPSIHAQPRLLNLAAENEQPTEEEVQSDKRLI